MERWYVNSSSPIATTRPPEDRGDLVRIGDAEAGKGFRLTGEGVLLPLALDAWVWNAEKEGMSTEGYPNCFQRGSGGAELVGMAGAMPSPSAVVLWRTSTVDHFHQATPSSCGDPWCTRTKTTMAWW